MLPLQGFKQNDSAFDPGLGALMVNFPNNIFPRGAIHEFICVGNESAAASSGFIAGILTALMREAGAILWIGPGKEIFPPGLISFGIEPDRIIFMELYKEKEILWTMEESLKCVTLAAVVCEIRELNFMVSRRLQLAVEQSGVTGFILRRDPRQLGTTTCISRWKITSLPSVLPGEMPGVGFPRWNVELLKIRNGKPGNWTIEWSGSRFRVIQSITATAIDENRHSRKYA